MSVQVKTILQTPQDRAEGARQSQLFYDAISTALDEATLRVERPMLNGVLGALAQTAGGLIAACPDGKSRKTVRQSFERLVKKVVTDANREQSQ